jgi:hypothetical protein
MLSVVINNSNMRAWALIKYKVVIAFFVQLKRGLILGDTKHYFANTLTNLCPLNSSLWFEPITYKALR